MLTDVWVCVILNQQPHTRLQTARCRLSVVRPLRREGGKDPRASQCPGVGVWAKFVLLVSAASAAGGVLRLYVGAEGSSIGSVACHTTTEPVVQQLTDSD